MTRLRFALPLALLACADPVREAQIAELGGEDDGVPIGELHRPGQPCVVCHSRGGPAASSPFAIAGTVFKSQARDAKPAVGITIQFVDANNGAPRILPATNAAGSFFVRESEWPDLAFPVRVGLYTDPAKPPKQAMKSLIGREGSCNACHLPNIDGDPKRSAGQIYLNAGTE